MAQFGTYLIATFSVLALWSIYAAAGPIGERPIAISDEAATSTALATTEVSVQNETTGVIDTLTTEIDLTTGGNETHIRQKRSCGCGCCCCRPCCCCCRPCCCCRCCCCRCCCCCCRCCCCRCCCCRPCCCGCGGCGCCGCGGGRKRRAIQELSHKLMNKHAEFGRQIAAFDVEEAAISTTTTTTEFPLPEATTLATIRRVTNAEIDSYGRRQF